MVAGMMVSVRICSGGGEDETVTVTLASTTELSALVNCAVMAVVPALWPVTNPLELTVAIAGMLEVQVMAGEFVTFSRLPVVPDVPRAMSCPVPPEDNVSELGVTVIP